MTTALQAPGDAPQSGGKKPLTTGNRTGGTNALVYIFVIAPFVALLAAAPVAWGWGLGWHDLVLFAVFYSVGCLGITVGFHRHFTHSSFKAKTPLRVGLAIAGSLALEGSVISWVADHRRHHAFSDKEGDPHSPWRFGTSPAALAKGFAYSHMGWILASEQTNPERFAPDLVKDRHVAWVSRTFGLWVLVSLLAPAVIGGLWSMSWAGALTAFFWATLVRMWLLQHVTWSINSVCHMIGDRPFKSRDKSANFWPLAILSAGESWHNLHHADPTCARHGVQPGQIDISARVIWLFEKLGWAYNVRWPTPKRLDRLSAGK